MKVRARVNGTEYQKEYTGPVTAAQALADMGAPFYSPCGGKGVCGKCRVHIAGEYRPESPDGSALACRTVLTGDSYIIYNTTADKIQVLSSNGAAKIAPLGGEDKVGCAVDIGTTTVACSAYSLRDGSPLYTCGAPNPQAAHGADVISRIEFAASGGAGILQDEISACVGALACGERRVVTGNTAMLCLLCGEDVSGLRVWPFSAPSLFGHEKDGVYYAPCASPFFGADAVCAVAECMVPGEPCIVADIGTNAELFCYDGADTLLCTSASAGPCFEGGGMACGMPACEGAVNAVVSNGGGPEYSVIGGGKPRGLCGTGIADLAAYLLKCGHMDPSGRMAGTYYLTEDVFFTARDARSLQLAKSAVRAGIETLLDMCSVRGKIKKFYIAGGFGSALSPQTAADLGIIPREFRDLCVTAGNAALAGAARAVTDVGFRRYLEETARRCRCVELANSDGFERKFIKYMQFGG